MGKLSSLFGLKKATPETSLPSLSDPITPVAPWQGNLPCVHGPSDGCTSHNPAGEALFFAPSLLPNPKPTGIRPVANPWPNTPPEIHSSLPQDPALGCLTLLPRVHPSVPYDFAFYHLNALTSSFHETGNAGLERIGCVASLGSNPKLTFIIRSAITRLEDEVRLILKYELEFHIKADLGAWTPQTQHGRAVMKEILIGSGYRDFTPCKHTKISFKSHRGEGKNHVRTAGVSFVTKVAGDEKKGEWKSDESGQVEGVCCGRCYTDSYIGFKETDGLVTVTVNIYKDLGEGKHPAEEKWLAAARGVDLKRAEDDFGRMKRFFDAVEAAEAAAETQVAESVADDETLVGN
ncbi:hypothetical protein OQA88_7649 [Cercophora sp. LCS_1]